MLTSYSCIGNRVRSVIRDPATAAPGIIGSLKFSQEKLFFFISKKKVREKWKIFFHLLIKIPNITMMLEAHCTFRNNLLKLPTKYGNILDKPMIVPLKRSRNDLTKISHV